MIQAELYAVRNNVARAKACYKDAIVHSKANNFTHKEALSLERAVIFHLKIREKNDTVIILQQSY